MDSPEDLPRAHNKIGRAFWVRISCIIFVFLDLRAFPAVVLMFRQVSLRGWIAGEGTCFMIAPTDVPWADGIRQAAMRIAWLFPYLAQWTGYREDTAPVRIYENPRHASYHLPLA